MPTTNLLPLALGLVIFSFLIHAVLIVPFIDLLYKLKLTRRKEGLKGKPSLFDKLHDKKAGTPTGGGVLIVASVSIIFAILFPIVSYMGVFIQTAHGLTNELFVIFFTFISFGLLGLLDDYVKIFGKGRAGNLGQMFGLTKRTKFGLQWILGLVVGFWLYNYLGIRFIHIPLVDVVINLGVWYIPFAAFVIVFFTNAFNFTDGLDGLASGLLMIYLFAFVIIAAGNLDTPLSLFIALWLGGVIAFLYFNTWPARIFLGDTGALSFGAMIAVIGLVTGNVATLFVIGGIFVIEAFSSLIQILGWKFLHRPIFPIAPIHHAFLAMGWEEPKIVMRAWLAGIMLAIFGLWLARI
ncbi:MAG TPA: phospho-N-acetylmuramoyl-pentapeptide-transferase [Patescibacteria group bacterium]